MTVNYRALIAWFLLLIFVVFIVVRLDEKVLWNWFVVFIPMWLLDTLIVMYIVVFMVRHCTSGVDPGGRSMLHKVALLTCVGLKVLGQVLICVRVEYLPSMSVFLIAVPFWMLAIAAIADLSGRIMRRASACGSNCGCVCCKSD